MEVTKIRVLDPLYGGPEYRGFLYMEVMTREVLLYYHGNVLCNTLVLLWFPDPNVKPPEH